MFSAAVVLSHLHSLNWLATRIGQSCARLGELAPPQVVYLQDTFIPLTWLIELMVEFGDWAKPLLVWRRCQV